MATLNIDSLELVSSVRTAGLNAPPSSADYNETQREVLVDLSALADIINGLFIPYFSRLLDTSANPTNAPVGIEGRTIYSDTSDVSDIFYNAVASNSLSIADSLRLLRAMITLIQNKIGDLDVEIQAVQSRVSGSGSSNLTNVVQQLRNFYDALNNLVAQHTIQLQRLSLYQAARVVSDSLAPGNSEQVTILWPTAFPDDNYTVALALESGTGTMEINSFVRITGGTGIQVLITNNNITTSQAGTVHASAQPD